MVKFIFHFLFCLALSLNTKAQICKIPPESVGLHSCNAPIKSNKITVSGKSLHNYTHSILQLWIDPQIRYIKGQITHKVTLNYDTDSIFVDLNDSLQIDSIKIGFNKMPFSHSFHQVGISIGRFATKNDQIEFTIFYQGVPAVGIGFGSFMLGEHAGVPIAWTLSQPYGSRDWWPCQQNLGDKIDSIDVYIHCPNRYNSVSNGLLQSRVDSAGFQIAHFKHRHPIAPYLVAIAITNYTHFTENVSDGFTTFPVVNYVFPEDLAWLKDEFIHLPDQMAFFASLFGPYPFANEQYGHAQFTWGGGMEHQTMSFMFSLNFELMAHELAHQWFGNKITIASWGDIWLHESIATWLSGLCYEKFLDGFYWPLWRHNLKTAVTSIPDGSVFKTDTNVVRDLFNSRLTYRKGALVLHMLRYQLGDSTLIKGINQWLSDAENTSGFSSTEKFKLALEKISGKNLTKFFRQWIYEEGHPSFQLNYYQLGNKLWVQANQKRSVNYQEPIEVDFPFKAYSPNGFDSLEMRFSFSTQGQWQSFDVPFITDSLQFDPDSWILAGPSSSQKISPSQLHIYPNPSNGIFFISWLDSWVNSIQINVTNLQGKTLLRQNVNQQDKIPLNLSQFSDGVYILEILSNGEKTTKKLLLSK